MLKNYETANLIPLLDTIRKPGRYSGLNGLTSSPTLLQMETTTKLR